MVKKEQSYDETYYRKSDIDLTRGKKTTTKKFTEQLSVLKNRQMS